MISPTLVAFFLLLTAIAYVIAYAFYVRQTWVDQPNFFYVAIFYLIAGIFFLIYAIVNYVKVSRGKKNKTNGDNAQDYVLVNPCAQPEKIRMKYQLVD